jgi:hypothetical protein
LAQKGEEMRTFTLVRHRTSVRHWAGSRRSKPAHVL